MACNGPRPIELCAVREWGVNLDSNPATITYTAEYSKMRVARTRPLTREAANQLRLWDKFKYRTRWTTVKDEENGESVRKFAAPKRNVRLTSTKYGRGLNAEVYNNQGNKEKKSISFTEKKLKIVQKR